MLKSEMELESDLGIDSIKRMKYYRLFEHYPHVSELDQESLQSLACLADLEKAMSNQQLELSGESGALGKSEAALEQPIELERIRLRIFRRSLLAEAIN